MHCPQFDKRSKFLGIFRLLRMYGALKKNKVVQVYRHCGHLFCAAVTTPKTLFSKQKHILPGLWRLTISRAQQQRLPYDFYLCNQVAGKRGLHLSYKTFQNSFNLFLKIEPLLHKYFPKDTTFQHHQVGDQDCRTWFWRHIIRQWQQIIFGSNLGFLLLRLLRKMKQVKCRKFCVVSYYFVLLKFNESRHIL